MNYNAMFEKLLNYGGSEMYRLLYTMDHPELIDESISLIQQIVNCDEQNAKLLYVDFSKHNNNFIEENKEEIEKDSKALKEYAQSLINKQSNLPTCPICHSTNVQKISGLSRMASVGFFGIGSKKIGKQWHCNNCKSDF